MTPVVLLGGLNVVRALGLAGIPVIIASSARCMSPTAGWRLSEEHRTRVEKHEAA